MKVTYIGSGDVTDSAICSAFGHEFALGQAVEMDDVPPKLLTNPSFSVEGDPLDPDGDARPAVEGEKAVLQAQLTELGVKYHHNAGVATLTALLEAATAPAPAEPEA